MFFQDTWYIRLLKQVTEEEGLDMNLKIGNFDEKQLKILLHGTDKVYRVIGPNRFGKQTAIYEKWTGLLNEFERRFLKTKRRVRKWM